MSGIRSEGAVGLQVAWSTAFAQADDQRHYRSNPASFAQVTPLTAPSPSDRIPSTAPPSGGGGGGGATLFTPSTRSSSASNGTTTIFSFPERTNEPTHKRWLTTRDLRPDITSVGKYQERPRRRACQRDRNRRARCRCNDRQVACQGVQRTSPWTTTKPAVVRGRPPMPSLGDPLKIGPRRQPTLHRMLGERRTDDPLSPHPCPPPAVRRGRKTPHRGR